MISIATFDAQKYRKTRRQDLIGRASGPLEGVKTKIHNAHHLHHKSHRCVFTTALLRVPSAIACLTTPSAGIEDSLTYMPCSLR